MTAFRKLNRKPVVLTAMGWSNSTLYEKIKNQLFVAPVKLGLRSSGWPSDEQDAIQDAYIAGKSQEEIRVLVQKLQAARKEVS